MFLCIYFIFCRLLSRYRGIKILYYAAKLQLKSSKPPSVLNPALGDKDLSLCP